MTPPISTEELAQKRTRARSNAMAQAVATAFSEILRAETHKHGGFIGLRHLDELDQVFQAKAKELTKVFEKAFMDSHREQENIKWQSIKRPAFDRLMVKHFENLFFARGGTGAPHGIISRRVLPGFFLALNMMLGPEALKSYQNRCDKALDRVMGGDIPVDWNLVEKDVEVQNVILDAQYTIAHYFEDPFQRADWFIHIINANLAPATPGASDASWFLDQRALFKMIGALLLDLKKAVLNDVTWTRLAMRHEGADREKLKAILSKL
jgi:hypothetical protein